MSLGFLLYYDVLGAKMRLLENLKTGGLGAVVASLNMLQNAPFLI